MTDRPSAGGADVAVGPTPGYYPDPSVPGFVRYWGGSAWVPGTSRPAPAEGEVLDPPRIATRPGRLRPASLAGGYVPPPVVEQPSPEPPEPVELAVAEDAEDTGPVFFDQTSGGASFSLATYAELELELRPRGEVVEAAAAVEPEAPTPVGTGWIADPGEQPGLLADENEPRWVSWGVLPPAVPAPAPAPAPAPGPAPVPAPVPVVVEPVGKTIPEPTPRVRASRRAAPRPPAGLGRRLFARLVDTLVLAAIGLAAGVPLVSSAMQHVQLKLAEAQEVSAVTHRQVQVWLIDPLVVGKLAVLLGVLLLAGVLYEVLPTARTGQTFGKRLVGVRVVDVRKGQPPSAGRSVSRWLVGLIGAVLLLGLIWPLLDGTGRRGWQDRAAGTRVVRA